MIHTNRNESRELIINTMLFGMSAVVSKLIVFLLLPLYTIYLTTAEYGTGELVVNLMNFLMPFVSLHILSALLRYGMDEKQDKREVLFYASITILLGVVIVSIILQFVHLDSAVEQWKGYLVTLLVAYMMSNILSVFSKSLDKTKICAIGGIIYAISLLLGNLLLLMVLHRGIAGYIESMVFANLIMFFYYCKALKIHQFFYIPHTINWSLWREMLVFSIPLIFNSIYWWMSSFCDRFIIEYYMGESAVGIYSVAGKIPVLLTTISGVFMQAWTLSAIKIYDSGGNASFISDIYNKFWVLMVVSAGIFLCIVKPLVALFAHGDFVESWIYTPLLIYAAVISSLGTFYASLYTSAKRNTMVMITTAFGAIVNVGLNLVFIPMWGIQGAVVATFISYILVLVYRMIDSRRFIPFPISYFRLGFSIVILWAESLFLILGHSSGWGLLFLSFLLIVNIGEILKIYYLIIRFGKRCCRIC